MYTDKQMDLLLANVLSQKEANPIDEDSDELEDVSDTISTQLIKVNKESRLIESFHSAAGAKFALREYKGLTYELPENQDVVIKQGLFGIAAGYTIKEAEK